MHFENLQFYSYRNINDGKIDLCAGLNVFVGENAQGKTNILEAIHLLLTGKTFRPANNIHIINRDNHKDKTAIGGKYVDSSVKNFVELQISIKSKALFLNKKRIASTKIQEKYPLVVFSPESLSAIKEGPDQRRKLIDEAVLLFKKEGPKLISEFEKCLKTRNKILRDFKQEKLSSAEFYPLFDSINRQYYPLCSQLTKLRIQTLLELEAPMQKVMERISNNSKKIKFHYLVSNEEMRDKETQDIDEYLKNRQKSLSANEIISATSLFGPQKHDFQIIYDNYDSRYYCSQGQQRALILSFKIAQIVYYNARYGVFPLLLLDDVLSELDEEKRSFLVGFLKENKAQTFVSTTDLNFGAIVKNSEMKIFGVKNGLVEVLLENNLDMKKEGELIV